MNRALLQKLIFNRWVAFLHDLFWIPIAIIISYWLRFNLGVIPLEQRVSLVEMMPVALVVQGAAYWLHGLYRGYWRFASIPDFVRIVKSVIFGTLFLAITAFFITRLEGIPRSFFILYPLLIISGLALPRLVFRWFKDHGSPFHLKEGKRIIIVGAGRAGELLVRDLLHREEFFPLAFIDDDVSKHGRDIYGVRVLGGVDDLHQIVTSLNVEEIFIAIATADKASMRHIAKLCSQTGVPTRIIPSIFEITNNQVDSTKLRPITVEDLLGREPVTIDVAAISSYLLGKTILVSGGGGSIGSELCRQIALQKPACLIILDNGEFNLYKIDYELKNNHKDLQLESILGDVRNQQRVDWIFQTFAPDVVFHAAAYKHVPMVEINPAEGVMNNVCGTKVIADAADRFGADRFVLVSTDKAVNPANVMGATKRVAEIYCQNLFERSKTRFITTRFGNVLGSAGSVLSLFQNQIKNGGPVTVTHPEITRYFMIIPEAVSLILQAGSMGKGGEIFVLDMGEPILIQDLARQMILLSGLKPDRDIKIVFTGLRPGEKLFEEIFHEGEGLQQTSHRKLFLAKSRKVDWGWLVEEMTRLQQAAVSRDIETIKGHLRNIVPEFKAI